MKTIKLCILALALSTLAAIGCAPCPSTPPPASAEAGAILARVRQGLDASHTTAAESSPSYRRAVGHALALDSSTFWCEAASLYDELTAFEQEAVAGGSPIAPELTEAIALVKWAVDRAACACPTGGK